MQASKRKKKRNKKKIKIKLINKKEKMKKYLLTLKVENFINSWNFDFLTDIEPENCLLKLKMKPNIYSQVCFQIG